MDEPNKRNDIDGRIDEVFQAGNRRDDPAARLCGERLKAQVHSGRISSVAVRGILADVTKVSILIKKTRRDIDTAEAKKRVKKAAARSEGDRRLLATIPLLLANSEQTLANIGQMHVQLTDLLGAVQNEQAKMAATATGLERTAEQIISHTAVTVAATADLKAASETLHTEIKKAVRALTLRAAWRTAVFLTPLTLVSSVAGNKLTTFWDTGQWSMAPAPAPNPPPPALSVIVEKRQFWLILPPRGEVSPLPFLDDRPFIIPQTPIGHLRPDQNVGRRKRRVTSSKISR